MADKLDVEVTGKSIYEVAEYMAVRILISIEGKSWKDITRADYLTAVSQSFQVLKGYEPE